MMDRETCQECFEPIDGQAIHDIDDRALAWHPHCRVLRNRRIAAERAARMSVAELRIWAEIRELPA